MAEIVIIKNKLSPELQKMDFEKKLIRNPYPESIQGCFLKKNPYTKSFLTGYELKDSVEEIERRKQKHPEFEKYIERKKIEETFNIKLDNPDEDFLINYRMKLCDINNTEVQLNLDRLEDRFKYNALIAGGYVAPNKENLNDVKFLNTFYYFSKPKEEQSSRKEIAKIKNKIGAKLTVNEDNKVYLLAVAFKLGLNFSPENSTEILYTIIDTYKEKLTSLAEAKKTLSVLNEEINFLEKSLIIELATKFFLIKKHNVEGFVYEGVKIGKTVDEIKRNLLSIDYNETYLLVREQVYNQFKLTND